MRPICQACQQRVAAINYHRNEKIYYRRRCENCERKNRALKKRKPRWATAGFEKKLVCDRCGFRARYASQILVYHVDGNLNNTNAKNLKCVCLNCVEVLKRSDVTWKPGDLEPDSQT